VDRMSALACAAVGRSSQLPTATCPPTAQRVGSDLADNDSCLSKENEDVSQEAKRNRDSIA
jgi:hypothetical protein